VEVFLFGCLKTQSKNGKPRIYGGIKFKGALIPKHTTEVPEDPTELAAKGVIAKNNLMEPFPAISIRINQVIIIKNVGGILIFSLK